MAHYVRGRKKIVYVRGDGSPRIFNPSKRFIELSIKDYLDSGGKIKKRKKVLFEPKEISILFEREEKLKRLLRHMI